MSKEIPLQADMFSNALVDTRSRAQKSWDRQSEQLQQMAMFSARQTVQHGINARPWLKDLPAPVITLEIQDVRTEEEKERERRRIAEALTAPMFAGDEIVNGSKHVEEKLPEVPPADVSQTVYEAVNLRKIGFRAYARRKSIPVRRSGGNAFRNAA